METIKSISEVGLQKKARLYTKSEGCPRGVNVVPPCWISYTAAPFLAVGFRIQAPFSAIDLDTNISSYWNMYRRRSTKAFRGGRSTGVFKCLDGPFTLPSARVTCETYWVDAMEPFKGTSALIRMGRRLELSLNEKIRAAVYEIRAARICLYGYGYMDIWMYGYMNM